MKPIHGLQSYQHLCLEEVGMWCITGLENGKQLSGEKDWCGWPQVS